MPERRDETRLHRLGRRAFLRDGAILLGGAILLPRDRLLAAATDNEKPLLRLGLVTDLHYAEKEHKGTRFYRDTWPKFAEAAKRFREDKPEILVELGDLIDSADTVDAEKANLQRIAQEFAAVPGQHHYVLGNHCVRNLTKPDFLKIVGQERSYYSFDAQGFHFIVLDACFCSDGTPHGALKIKWPDASVPPAEMDWLREDLRQTPNKSIVFLHQCLNVDLGFGVANGFKVRKILEESGKVLAVVQGHAHYGSYQEIGGIHYCTLEAMVQGSGLANNAYALMDILPGNVLRITGFKKQKSYHWQS